MASNRTLRVVVSADPKPSLDQLEKDIQSLSSQLASGGTKLVVPVEIGNFNASKAIDKLKADIENALKNLSVNINGITVNGGGQQSGGAGSGGGGKKPSDGKSGNKNDIIDESSLKSKAYYSSASDAIKQIKDDLIASGQNIKNIKTSMKEVNGEVNGFSVDMKDALGNTEKLEYALRKVKDSAGTVRDAYVQINKSTIDTSGGKSGIANIRAAIDDIEKNVNIDYLNSLTKNLEMPQIDSVIASWRELVNTIRSAQNNTSELTEGTLNNIISLKTALERQVVEFRDLNYLNSPVDDSRHNRDQLKLAASSVDILIEKYNSLNSKYKISVDILESVRSRMDAIRNAQTNGVRDENLNGFDKYIEDADDLLNVISKLDEQYEILSSKANNMNLSDDAAQDFERLKISMESLRSMDLSQGAEEWNNALVKTQSLMDQVSSSLKKIKADENATKSFDRQKASVINLETSIKKAKDTLKKYYDQNSKLSTSPEFTNNYQSIINNDYGNTREGYAKLVRDVNNYKAAAKEAGFETQTLGDKIYAAYKKFGGWAIVTQTMQKAVAMFKNMISNVIELDTAMTELYKVTDETKSTYENFLKGTADSAREVGATMTDVINSTADFARLGYTLSESEELAKAALVYKSVGDGIKDVSEATQSIISTMKAFGMEAESTMEIVDKMNYTGNNFAISSAGVGDALIRSASALSAAGNSLSESIALITAMNSTVQDTDKVGTVLKTLTMYLRAAKEDAEAAGESTDGMATSVSKLRESVLSLTGNKVDIMLDGENFKNTYTIMKGISGVWKDISDVDQAALLELIAGKRNADAVLSLIKNFQTAEEVLNGVSTSAGSANQELATFQDSIEGRMNGLKTSFQELSSAVVNSNLIKYVVTGGDKILNVIAKITESIGAFPGIMSAISVILTKNDLGISSTSGKSFGERWSNQFSKIDYKGAAEQIKKYNDSLSLTPDKMKDVIAEISLTNDSLGKFISKTYDSSKSVEANTVTLEAYKKSMSSLGMVVKSVGTLIKNAAASFAIGLVLEVATKGIVWIFSQIEQVYKKTHYSIEEAKEALNSFNQTQSQITSNSDKLKNISARYEELSKGVNSNGKNVSLTNEEYTEFLSLVDDIIEISPSIVKSYDNQGKAVINYKDAIKEALAAQKEMNEYETANFISSMPGVYNGQKKEYKESYRELKDWIKDIYNATPTEDIFNNIFGESQVGILNDPQKMLEIAKNYKQYLTLIKGYKTDNGLNVFDSESIKGFETALNGMSSTYKKIQDATNNIVDGIKVWAQEQDWFKEIPEENLDLYYDRLSKSILNLGDDIGNLDKVKEIAQQIGESTPQYEKNVHNFVNSLEQLGDINNSIGDGSSAINSEIEAYKKAADMASELRKEYQETGKISVDTYISISKSVEDYAKILEVEGDAYKINDNELQKYIDSKRDAAVESALAANATADEISNLLKYGVTTSSINEKIGVYTKKLSALAKIQKDHADGTQYTKEETDELLESYPNLIFEVDETTGKFKLQEKSLGTLNDMLKNVIDSIITLSQEMMRLQGIDILKNVYGRSDTNASNQYSAYYDNAESNDIDTFEKWIEKYGEPTINEDAIRKAISSYAQKKALNKAFEDQDYTSIVSEDSKSGSGKTEDAYKSNFEEWYKTQQHYLNMGQISEEEYYDALEEMNNSYFAGMEKYLDEYRKYEEEVYKGRQGLVSDALTKIDDEYAKHGNNSEAIKQIDALTEKYKDVLSPDLQKTIDTKKLSYTVALYNEQSDELQRQLDILDEQEGSEKEQIDIYKKLQDEVIRLSNYYKSIGYSDDSETLKELEDKWLKYAQSIRKIAKGMYDDIKDAQIKALEEINDTIDEANDAIDDVLSEVVNYIKRKTQDEIDALEDERDAISDHYDDLKDQEEEYWDNIKESENDSYDYRKEQSEKYYDDLIDNIEKARDAAVKALDDELDKYKKLIDAKKESLQEAKDEEDYNKKVAEMNKNISSIQGQIDLLALDNSQEARAKRLDLEQQLADAMNELAEYQAEYSLNKQLDALDKEYDAFEESIKKQQDLIEEKAKNDIDIYEKERDEKLDAIEKVHNAELESIEQRKEKALQRIEDEKSAELAAYDEKINALEDYLNQEGTLYRDANELIRSGGESLWNELMEYCRVYYKEVESLEDAWKKVLSAVDEYNGGDLNLSETKNKLNDKKNDNESQIDELDNETYQRLVDKTRKEMRRNGEDWWMTEDTELRQQLSDANKQLAKAFNDSVGYEALTYDPKKGIWLLDGVRFYHEGGIVGKNKKLKNDETFAVLKDGEAVYTSKMQDTIAKFIDFAKNITGSIDSVVAVKDPARNISRSFERDVMPRYSSDVVIDHLFEFKADNVTSEAIPETEKMMKRVSEYTIGLLEDRLTRRGLKAKIKGSAI